MEAHVYVRDGSPWICTLCPKCGSDVYESENTAKNAALRCRLMISNMFYIATVIYVELTNGHGTFQTRRRT